MKGYRLTKKADKDVSQLYEYGIGQFGLKRAKIYLHELIVRFEVLTENPALGRSAADVYPGLRRIAYKAHSIFYLLDSDGLLIVRVLRTEMDFKRQFEQGI